MSPTSSTGATSPAGRKQNGARRLARGAERGVGPRRIWAELKPYLGSRRRVAMLVVATILAGLSQAALLVLIGQLAISVATDRAQSLGPFEDVAAQTLIFVAFALVGLIALLQTSAAYLSARMSAESLTLLRGRLAGAFLRAEWDLRSREREGRLQEHLSNHAFQISGAVLAFGTLLAAGVNLGALAAAALVVSPLVTTAMLIGGGLLTVGFRPLMSRIRRASRRQVRANVEYAEMAAESVRIAQELVVFDVGDVYERRMTGKSREVTRPLLRARFLQRATPDWFRDVALIAILAGLLIVESTDTSEIASLTVIVLLLLRAVTYGRELQAGITRFHEVMPYLEDVDRAVKEYSDAALPTGGTVVTTIEELRLENVSYTYPGGAGPAVEDLNLTARRGEAIGVVGPSGSGKSTMFQLLLRLRSPNDGEYLVNGEAAANLQLQSWFERIAVVHQDLQLVAGTIADNIRFFRDGISDEQVEKAARLAHVLDEIREMPNGFDTAVEGATGGVSGGQRQRICLARALVGKPDVIFLDEPTSALDSQAEAMVTDALNEMKDGIILFVISHRPSTLDACDQLIIMRDGHIEATEQQSMT